MASGEITNRAPFFISYFYAIFTLRLARSRVPVPANRLHHALDQLFRSPDFAQDRLKIQRRFRRISSRKCNRLHAVQSGSKRP